MHRQRGAQAARPQLAGRGNEERTPTQMVIFLQGKFYLENDAVL
jgi:hypothetical protein